MVRFLFVIIVFVSSSCKKERSSIATDTESFIVQTDSIIKEEFKTKDSIFTNEPIKPFIDFVKSIEKDGWIHDIKRVEKVVGYGLRKEDVVNFKGRPFFQVPFSRTELFYLFNKKHAGDYSVKILSSLDYEIFETTRIWAYFYRNIKSGDLIEDGVIEQWTFLNEEEAQRALAELVPLGGKVLYFNTTPYFTRLKNNVFIFHTRAMAFSYTQKEVYEKFLKLNSIKNE